MKIILTYIFILFSIFGITSCDKNVEVAAPANAVNGENVFLDDLTASAVLTGIYATLSSGGFHSHFLSIYTGLSADEFALYDFSQTGYVSYYQNKLSANISGDVSIWTASYPLIYRCNAAIEGISASSKLSPAVKQQLLGEAKFTRAFMYFNLVNLYGDVPLVLSTNYKINASLKRTEVANVYQQIINDLKDAKDLLSSSYVTSKATGTTSERIRPNKSTAIALLARIYLYNKNYSEAEAESSALIGNKSQYDTVGLESTFLKNTKETIWALQPVATGRNTDYARLLVLPAAGPSGSQTIYLNDNFNSIFDLGDKRKGAWTGNSTSNGKTYYYPYKYRIYLANQAVNEYTIIFRISEQYLIRAEARAYLPGKWELGRDDLNVIRKRAGLGNTTANTAGDLLTAIEKERRVELFTEGHRWFDIKRTARVNDIMSVITPQKGGIWKTEWQLYPVPNSDRLLDGNISQNPEYEK